MNLHNGVSITDWTHYEEKAKSMTVDQLEYAILDCRQAMEVAPAEAIFPCKAYGFYMDELCTYSDELRRRKKDLDKTGSRL
jgi:hypothetical protein